MHQDDSMNREASTQLFAQLSEPMPPEALKDETSRGFGLTSIKAAFVLERLIAVFGLPGYGWRYATTPHRVEGKEILVEVALQWRVTEDADQGTFCRPYRWGTSISGESGQFHHGWCPDTDRPAVWSEPIFATGGSSTNRKGSVPMTDAHRSAVTNGLTKAAARLGVGIEIWKGERDPEPASAKKAPGKRKAPSKSDKPTPPTSAPPANESPSLDAARKAAQAAFMRLEKVEDTLATRKDYQPLATQMRKLGLEMPVVKLLYLLLGRGDTSKRRVMACHNFVQTPMGQNCVALLNGAAEQANWQGLEE